MRLTGGIFSELIKLFTAKKEEKVDFDSIVDFDDYWKKVFLKDNCVGMVYYGGLKKDYYQGVKGKLKELKE